MPARATRFQAFSDEVWRETASRQAVLFTVQLEFNTLSAA